MTLSEVSDTLHRLPGLSESTVFEIQRSEEGRGPRTAGGFETTIKRRGTFRVLLKADKKAADVEQPTLFAALEMAFRIIGLPMPDEFRFIED